MNEERGVAVFGFGIGFGFGFGFKRHMQTLNLGEALLKQQLVVIKRAGSSLSRELQTLIIFELRNEP